MFGQQNQQANDDSVKDINLQNPNDAPQDTVQQISWFPNQYMKLFTTCGWEGKLRIYEVSGQPQQQFGGGWNSNQTQQQSQAIVQKMCIDLQDPILSTCWKADGTKIYAAVDQQIREIDVQTQQQKVIGQHDAGISSLFYNQNNNTLISTSFDSTFRIWQGIDQNQPQPMVNRLNHKVFCADFRNSTIILGLQNEKILVQDVNKLQYNQNQQFQYIDCQLGNTSQIQCIALFTNGMGFGAGSIDGRSNLSNLALDYSQNYKTEQIMTFKCHKTEQQASYNQPKTQVMYPVNTIGFNPRNDKFLFTGGAEGNLYFWDYNARNKIRSFHFNQQSVSTAVVDPTGYYIAYAIGYDWHEGPQGHNKYKPRICAHYIADNELRFQEQKKN